MRLTIQTKPNEHAEEVTRLTKELKEKAEAHEGVIKQKNADLVKLQEKLDARVSELSELQKSSKAEIYQLNNQLDALRAAEKAKVRCMFGV